MSCPDLDRLIRYHREGEPDPDLEAHLRECQKCQADLFVIRELPHALRPPVDVPEWLVARVLADLPHVEPDPRTNSTPPLQLVLRAVLGVITALAAFVATGSISPENLELILLLSLLVGGGSVVLPLHGSLRLRTE